MKSESVTPAQSRTRTAILQAALSVFMGNNSASLAEVARKAEVARSTVHRYFPSVADLRVAITEFAHQQVELVAERSRIHEGPPLDAMMRLALEYYEHWDAVMWDYMANTAQSDFNDPSAFDMEVNARLKEGQADGSIDATMPAEWIQHAMFAVVYSAWEYTSNGHPRSEAAMMVMATMRKVMCPMDSPVVPPVQSSGA